MAATRRAVPFGRIASFSSAIPLARSSGLFTRRRIQRRSQISSDQAAVSNAERDDDQALV